MEIFFLFFIYLLSTFYLLSKRDFALTIIILVYSGPVSAVFLHLIYPESFIMGGGNLELQTFEVTKKMFLISVLGILGLALSYVRPSRLYFLPDNNFSIKLSSFEIFFWSIASIALIWFIMPSAKILLDADYHYSMAATREIPGINVSRTIAHSILIIVFISSFLTKTYFKTVTFLILFSLVYFEILSGIRSEAMGVIVAMIAYYFNYYKKNPLNNSLNDIKKISKQKIIMISFFILLLGLVWLIGNTRTGGRAVGNFETFEAVAATFMAAIYAIDSGAVELLKGTTYTIDLIMQTLPTSIFPDRPLVPAQIILQQEVRSSGGAFFAGTAYMNFGILGSFIMMFLLGRLFQFLTNSINKANFNCNVSSILYMAFVMSIFRLMYYSELSTYKIMITGLLALLMIYFTSRIMVVNSIKK